MSTLLRHLVALLALPVVATILVPVWIARSDSIQLRMPSSLAATLLLVLALVLLMVGLALFAACLFQFAARGRGTLAPWDPPRHLVVLGPYRYVRNPMISGVIFVLFGEALLLGSMPHALWAVAFAGLNAIYIPSFEEPQLERRFGEDYRVYKQNVRRFLPRLRPWSPV